MVIDYKWKTVEVVIPDKFAIRWENLSNYKKGISIDEFIVFSLREGMYFIDALNKRGITDFITYYGKEWNDQCESPIGCVHKILLSKKFCFKIKLMLEEKYPGSMENFIKICMIWNMILLENKILRKNGNFH